MSTETTLPHITQVAVEEQPPEEQHNRLWRAFAHNRLALLGAMIAILMLLCAVFAGVISPFDPAEMHPTARFVPPSYQHLMGTDQFGRDLFSRLVYGARVSLSVGLASMLILIVIGVTLGAVAGYLGGVVDTAIMRFVDVMMSIPRFFLILAIVALFGPSLHNTILVIGFTSWMGTARLVRGQILSLREREFIYAAQALGASNTRILLYHLIPNTLAVIIVQATLFISYAILIETSLSYLGLGIQPPEPSWGNLLSGGKLYMATSWWLTLFPGLAISLTVLAFNMLGDGLQDAFDPRAGK